MARVSSVTTGTTISSTTFGNALITDYLSQTDTTEQNLASNLNIGANLLKTTDLAIKQVSANYLGVRDDGDTTDKSFQADYFQALTAVKTNTIQDYSGDLTTFGNDISIGAYLLKTTNLAIKEGDANTFFVRDAGDTGDKNIKAGVFQCTNQIQTNYLREYTSGQGVSIGDDKFVRTFTTETLGVGVTTFVATGEFMEITGDGGANVVATITGGVIGHILRLIFVDGLVTITDTDAHGANTVDLAGNATDLVSADDTTLTLIFDGTSWYELARSVN